MRRLAALVLVALVVSGCVRQVVAIRSIPPGAAIYLNEEYQGTTPATVPFTWYATHRIALVKEGFESFEATEALKAPWYMVMPYDLLATLLPWPITDRHELDYTLQPVKSMRELEQAYETPEPPGAR